MVFLQAVKTSGEIVDGYFRGLHRGTGAVALSSHKNSEEVATGIGVKTLASFKKYRIDRLGLSRTEVTREVRTWHGKACT